MFLCRIIFEMYLVPYYRSVNVLVPRAAGQESLPSVRKVMKNIENAVAVVVAAYPGDSICVEGQIWSHIHIDGTREPKIGYSVSIVFRGQHEGKPCQIFESPTLAGAVGAALLAKGGIS